QPVPQVPPWMKKPEKPSPTPVPQAGPANPLGTLLPTVALLRDVGIPLLVYAVFLALLVVWLVSFIRRVRGSRRT
ncbi:MAG TPA: peptidase S8, partial [Terrimesophilobacter sp.]|nr:peptidase S8 [Terrimesophilobacter sp.]